MWSCSSDVTKFSQILVFMRPQRICSQYKSQLWFIVLKSFYPNLCQLACLCLSTAVVNGIILISYFSSLVLWVYWMKRSGRIGLELFTFLITSLTRVFVIHDWLWVYCLFKCWSLTKVSAKGYWFWRCCNVILFFGETGKVVELTQSPY